MVLGVAHKELARWRNPKSMRARQAGLECFSRRTIAARSRAKASHPFQNAARAIKLAYGIVLRVREVNVAVRCDGNPFRTGQGRRLRGSPVTSETFRPSPGLVSDKSMGKIKAQELIALARH